MSLKSWSVFGEDQTNSMVDFFDLECRL